MKASEAFFRGLPRRIRNRYKRKVFIIGFHKTGTSSMGKAFQILGYRVCGSIKEAMDFGEIDQDPREYILNKALKLTSKYDCFQDTPWFMFYRELYELFPEAHFILTKRPDEDWIRSVRDHFGNRNNSNYHSWIYGYQDPISHEDIYLSKFREHNKAVEDFFKNKNNFLTIDLSEKDKWKKICSFLQVSEPMYNFPYVNTKKSRKNVYSVVKQKLKNLYYC
jgi:hypothetical protein